MIRPMKLLNANMKYFHTQVDIEEDMPISMFMNTKNCIKRQEYDTESKIWLLHKSG